jgi:hypothetical protein
MNSVPSHRAPTPRRSSIWPWQASSSRTRRSPAPCQPTPPAGPTGPALSCPPKSATRASPRPGGCATPSGAACDPRKGAHPAHFVPCAQGHRWRACGRDAASLIGASQQPTTTVQKLPGSGGNSAASGRMAWPVEPRSVRDDGLDLDLTTFGRRRPAWRSRRRPPGCAATQPHRHCSDTPWPRRRPASVLATR